VHESNRKVISMVNATASTADAGPAIAAVLEASLQGQRTVMPASASAVYPATSAWDPGPAPGTRPVVGTRIVSRPSIASSIHGSFTTRYVELSCASSVVAPLPAAAVWAADSDVKVSEDQHSLQQISRNKSVTCVHCVCCVVSCRFPNSMTIYCQLVVDLLISDTTN